MPNHSFVHTWCSTHHNIHLFLTKVIRRFMHVSTHSFILKFSYWFISSFTYLLSYSLIRSSVQLLIDLVILIHFMIHPLPCRTISTLLQYLKTIQLFHMYKYPNMRNYFFSKNDDKHKKENPRHNYRGFSDNVSVCQDKINRGDN